MSRLAQSLYETQFEEEEREFKSEQELMAHIRRQEIRNEVMRKKDKNYDWQTEDGEDY